jgi:hypothetical protein
LSHAAGKIQEYLDGQAEGTPSSRRAARSKSSPTTNS